MRGLAEAEVGVRAKRATGWMGRALSSQMMMEHMSVRMSSARRRQVRWAKPGAPMRQEQVTRISVVALDVELEVAVLHVPSPTVATLLEMVNAHPSAAWQ